MQPVVQQDPPWKVAEFVAGIFSDFQVEPRATSPRATPVPVPLEEPSTKQVSSRVHAEAMIGASNVKVGSPFTTLESCAFDWPKPEDSVMNTANTTTASAAPPMSR
jgi:hypothetical protein